MDSKQTPAPAQPKKQKFTSQIRLILHNRKVVIGLVVGLLIVALVIIVIVFQRQSQTNQEDKAYPLAAKQRFIVESVSNGTAQLKGSGETRTIKNANTTYVYQNLPPLNVPATFAALQAQQVVQVLDIEKNTIVYIADASDQIFITDVVAESNVPNRTIQITNPDAFLEAVNATEWNYNTPPPSNITINLVSSPQESIFIAGNTGNTISTSAQVDGENIVVSLYVNPTYIQNETPEFLNQFATAAVLAQIYSSMNPTLSNSETLAKTDTAMSNSTLLMIR